MRKLALLSLLFVIPVMAYSQVASYGNLYISGKNKQGFNIFMIRCYNDQCVGLQGKELGSVEDVAKQLPYIPASAIIKYNYKCWDICRDNDWNIIGRPSPNYRNPYKKP